MPNSLEQQRLLNMLREHELLAERGYEFTILGGILVERAGHARGLWRCGAHGFSWTPAGYNEPQEWVGSAEAALRHTLFVLSVG